MLESGVLGAALLGVTAILMGAVIWLAIRSDRGRRDAEKSAQRFDEALRAKEIENEVEALSHDDLKSRSRRWVRTTNR
jgi:hypothetical protein